jgi:hypothetical protein
MRTSLSKSLAAAVLLAVVFVPAQAQLPKRDLAIEVRQVDSRDGNRSEASVVGTQSRAAALVAQKVVVRNGEKATLRFNVFMPVQWVQRIDSQAFGPQTGASGQSTGTGMTNAITWTDAGQSMVVTPRWTSAKQPVVVEIEILTAAVDERTGTELPNQLRSQTATTVSAPLGEWVTIATEGQPGKAGVYSSAPSADVARMIQLRVTSN